MKNNSLKIICSALGLWIFLLITPTFVAAEEKDSNIPVSIGINILNENSQNAEVLDVEVNDLLGIESIDVKVPNAYGNAEEIASISITDESIGNVDAGILTSTETAISQEHTGMDIAIEDVPIVNNVTVEVLNHEENTSDNSMTMELALVDVAVEDLIVTDDVDVEVLNQKENTSDNSMTSESALVNVALEDLIATDNLDVEVLKQEENSSGSFVSNESTLVDVAVEDLIVSDDVDVEVLNQKENSSGSFVSDESALVDVALEDLIVTDDVDVEVLKQEENSSGSFVSDESALVDVSVEDLIVSDDVNVEVLKQKENSSDSSSSDESSLVDVAVEDLIVTDDIDVEVLKQEENTTTSGSFSEENVIGVIVEDSIIADQLELNVFNEGESKSNPDQMELHQSVHLSLNDIPLLETLHVGVLEDQTNSLQESSKVLTVGLGEEGSFPTNSLLDKMELNVIENEQSWSENSNAEKNAAVSLELDDTNLGDLTANVMLSELVNSDDSISNTSGLVELNTGDLPLLENIHLGILDRHKEDDGEKSYISEGVLQLDIVSDLTDEISADILTNDELVNEEGTYRNRQTVTIGSVNDLFGETIIDILPTESFVASSSNPLTPIPGDKTEEGVIENPDINGEEEGLSPENNTFIPGTDTVNNDEGLPTNDPVAQNDGNIEEEATEELTSYPDEEIIVADGDSESKDTMIENPDLTDDNESVSEEENLSGIGANFNNIDGNFFTGSSLPQTGGFFTGIMLLFIALSLLGSGWTIRKLA